MFNGFFDCKDVSVAVNFKVASSSIARAVIKAHWPEINSLITTPAGLGEGKGTAYPAGKNAENTRWHGMVPKCMPRAKPVLLLVRDPIQKFRSACSEDSVASVPHKLTMLESDVPRIWKRNTHFWPQSRFLQNADVTIYHFETQLEEFCAAAGLEYPLTFIGQNKPDPYPKPTLTAPQRARVLALYARDTELHDACAEAPVLIPMDADADSERNIRRRVLRKAS